MPRPKSAQKRNDILAACQAIILRDGVGATTADIAKEAGIATGSLFTYFPTKVDLFNELYVTLKRDMTDALNRSLHGDTNKDKLHNAWVGWTNWAALNADKHRALERLRLSDYITSESLSLGSEAVRPVLELMNSNIVHQKTYYPDSFLYELIDAVSIKTMDKMAMYPDKAMEYCEAGFVTMWKIITKE